VGVVFGSNIIKSLSVTLYMSVTVPFAKRQLYIKGGKDWHVI
jgi:hypothetical protein